MHHYMPPTRQIIVADSLKWLETQRDRSIPNVVTGICDLDEVDLTMDQYLEFFKSATSLIFQKLDPRGYAVFIQTDRKFQREWIDKSFLLNNTAKIHGLKLVWHKIVLHREVDRTDLYRPGFAHMLCYTVNGTSGAASPDVIPVSRRLYKNGTPIEAATRAIAFIDRYTGSSKVILDPFVGRGTIPAIANNFGMDAIGIDIDPAQAEKARRMNMPLS